MFSQFISKNQICEPWELAGFSWERDSMSNGFKWGRQVVSDDYGDNNMSLSPRWWALNTWQAWNPYKWRYVFEINRRSGASFHWKDAGLWSRACKSFDQEPPPRWRLGVWALWHGGSPSRTAGLSLPLGLVFYLLRFPIKAAPLGLYPFSP